MNIAITNGSLSSLILSHMILDSNLSKSINITIFDEKAEIGFPNSGSGLLINKNKIFNLLETWCENFKMGVFRCCDLAMDGWMN